MANDQFNDLLDLINNPQISKELAKTEIATKPLDIVDKLIALEDLESSQELMPIKIPPLEEIRQAKLTVVERAAMEEFIARKCPGLEQMDKNRMLALFLVGHDVMEIIKIFPGSTVGGIAFLKVRDNWEGQRKEFLESIQYRSKIMLAITRNKSIFTITSLVNTFNETLEQALRNYAGTGDISAIPKEFIPHDIKSFKELMGLLKTFSDIKLTDNNVPQEKPQTAIQLNVTNNQLESSSAEAKAFEFLEKALEGKKK